VRAGDRRLRLGPSLTRGPAVNISIDGHRVDAYVGETVAAVLFVEHKIVVRTTTLGMPRGVFCGMGSCFDCLVIVDGVSNTRACMTWVREGMEVRCQDGLGPA
jgi:predicted molibdopterin-dependent oxidoreductase YjgC